MMLKSSVMFLANLLVVFLLVNLSEGHWDRNPIGLVNGGYNNLLVAIQKDVPEDTALIDEIKDIFTQGSAMLFHATNNRVYWNTITILIPITWSRIGPYGVARLEAYENANTIVTTSLQHEPFVNNPFGCGTHGRYIHLSEQFVSNELYREVTFGSSDKVIVRQWAKLRWGVFDEHYDPGNGASPHYFSFMSPNMLEGTRCSEDVHGSMVDISTFDNNCARNIHGVYPDSCVFVPNLSEQSATASLMFASDIDSIDGFCNEFSHNYEAPSAQNRNCNYESVWEVMRQSADFRHGNSPALNPFINTDPTFLVVQPADTFRVVLVLDISGSMDLNDRFEKMIQGSINYLRDIVPSGSSVGIVEFSKEATINSYLVEIDGMTSRNSLVQDLPPDIDSTTCIGCGILKGIEILQRNEADSSGGFLILLSDGDENESPYIVEVLDDIDSAGIIIDTIAFAEADLKMEGLAERTGGISAACPDGSTARCVIDAFIATVTRRPDSFPITTPIQLISSTKHVPGRGSAFVNFFMDYALGIDTVMTFTSLHPSISVIVRGPHTYIDDRDVRYSYDTSSKIITIRIADAETGMWSLQIDNSHAHDEFVSVAVTSKARPGIRPVVASAFLGSTNVNYTQDPFVNVYAHVHIDYEPVFGVEVMAYIESTSSGTEFPVLLQDNGIGADLITNDGIYSAYFLDFDENGRYGVRVDVNGTSMPQSMGVAQQGRFARDVATASTTLQPQPSNTSFVRTTSGGVFQVENYVPNMIIDLLAPSKIADLRSSQATYEDDRRVELTWTAVGDDFVQGQASYYELRYSTNFTTIRKNFTASTEVTPVDIMQGSLTTVAAPGNRESIVIALPADDSNPIYSFALRAWDEASNAGDLSDIISVAGIAPLPITTTKPTTSPPDVYTEPPPPPVTAGGTKPSPPPVTAGGTKPPPPPVTAGGTKPPPPPVTTRQGESTPSHSSLQMTTESDLVPVDEVQLGLILGLSLAGAVILPTLVMIILYISYRRCKPATKPDEKKENEHVYEGVFMNHSLEQDKVVFIYPNFDKGKAVNSDVGPEKGYNHGNNYAFEP